MARRLARLITFVLALALAAPAAADPAAEEVRGKVRAAVGYDAFRKLEHGVVLDGKARHDGFPGTFTLRLRPDGRYAVVIDTKTGFATGFDGKGRWSRRCTTPALPVELRYGDIYRFQYGILGHRWLAADGGFTVAIDPAEHRPYRPCLVVRHPDCPTLGARVYLDPATWLPTRFSVLVDGGESVTEMADWRDVGGAKVPGWVAFGRYAGGSELTAATAAPAPPPPAGADPFAPPPPAADTAFVPAARAAAEAKVVDGVLLVRPAVNGAPGPWLMLNTGATSTSVAAAAADRLGLPTLGRVGVNPGIDTRYRTADRFTLGPATVSGLPLVEIPTERFAAMGEVIKAELGGMLGGDVLARVVLEADWGAGTAAVHDPRAYRPPAGIVWAQARFDDAIPYLPGAFEGKPAGLFQFGTGSNGALVLNAGAIRALDLLAGRPVEQQSSVALNGASVVYRGTGREFRVLGRAVSPVESWFMTASDGGVGYPYCLGSFSPSLLGPGTVVFDYPNRRIGFAPRP